MADAGDLPSPPVDGAGLSFALPPATACSAVSNLYTPLASPLVPSSCRRRVPASQLRNSKTTAHSRCTQTGVESFDVESWVVASCIDRMEQKLRRRPDSRMDTHRRNQVRALLLLDMERLGTPASEADRSDALRTAEFSADPVLSELAILRSATERLADHVSAVLSRTQPQARLIAQLQKEVQQLQENLKTAQQISRPVPSFRMPQHQLSPSSPMSGGSLHAVPPGTQLTTVAAEGPLSPSASQLSSVSRSPSIAGSTRQQQQQQQQQLVQELSRLPSEWDTEAAARQRREARRFRDLYPDCLWGLVTQALQHGVGDYDLICHTREPDPGTLPFPPRSRLRNEAAMFGLGKMGELLSQFPSGAILIRRLLLRCPADKRWEPGLMRPVVQIGGDTHAVHRKVPLRVPRVQRCKGVISYLGTKNSRRWEADWKDAAFENPTKGAIEVAVACSSVWGTSDPCNLVDERMEFFSTLDMPDQWVAVDFIDAVVIPHAYSFVSFHPLVAGYFPRNWVFQGSLDGKNWDTLREHENDRTLTKECPLGTWVVHPAHIEREAEVLTGAELEQWRTQARQKQSRAPSKGRDPVQDRVRQLEDAALPEEALRQRLAVLEARCQRLSKGDPLAMVMQLGAGMPWMEDGRPDTGTREEPRAQSPLGQAQFGNSAPADAPDSGFRIPSPRRLRVPTQAPAPRAADELTRDASEPHSELSSSVQSQGDCPQPGRPPDPIAEAGSRRYYRFFRVLHTGPNSFGNHQLQLTSLEIYGEIANVSQLRLKPPLQPLPSRDAHALNRWRDSWDYAKGGGVSASMPPPKRK